MRQWSYWTRNKLAILSEYLPALNRASKRATKRLYIDLMSGGPENQSRETGSLFDGSPRIAMSCDPPFTKVVLVEKDARLAEALRVDIKRNFPGDPRATVVEGDCNVVIREVLSSLGYEYRFAAIFVFIDQQVAEVMWETIRTLASFRNGQHKSEVWMLLSPTMINRSLGDKNGPPNPATVARVTAMFGTDDWLQILEAERSGAISPQEFRDEMVNLMRWRLSSDLGYAYTARIRMRMTQGGPEIYDMVFATDHPAGMTIMQHVYRTAAQREPQMRAEAMAVMRNRKAEESGQSLLFEHQPDEFTPKGLPAWKPDGPWDPHAREWWVKP